MDRSFLFLSLAINFYDIMAIIRPDFQMCVSYSLDNNFSNNVLSISCMQYNLDCPGLFGHDTLRELG